MLQFTPDIRFIKGIENVPEDAMSRGINDLLLDSCVEYQRFVEEQLLQLLQDNTTSLKLSKTRVVTVDLEVVCDTSTGRFGSLCL